MEQCGFRPARSTLDMQFVMRPSQELGRRERSSLGHALHRPAESARLCRPRVAVKVVLTRFGVPAKMFPVIRQHHGMRACVRTDDGEHSESLDVTQGL